MQHQSTELTLLRYASRASTPGELEKLLHERADDFDWTLLVKTAFSHGVSGLLCNSLLSLPPVVVPAEIREAAHSHLQQQRTGNQDLADQLTHIIQELRQAGIEAIPFKGPTLADSVYGDLALRSFTDLDFLIQEKDIQRCFEKMQQIGYKQNISLSPRQMAAFLQYSGQDILYGEGIPVEPHWYLAPTTLALNIDYEGLWRRAGAKNFNSDRIAAFSLEDELIILCLHGSKEKWTKLKWVADVAKFIESHPKLDWHLIIILSENQGLARMVRLGLGLTNHLLQIQLPAIATKWLERDRFVLNWSKQLADEFFEVEKRQQSIYHLSRFHWDMRERISDKIRYLLRTITQPREQHFMDINLPDRLFFLYTPFKVLHDYLALPLWRLWKSCTTHSTAKHINEKEHTDATR